MTITPTAIAEVAARHGLTLGEAENLLRAQNATPEQQTGPPTGVPVTLPPDQVLAVEALVREGVPRVEAQGAVLHGDVEAFRSKIDAEKARMQEQADAAAQTRWALTPEGKSWRAEQNAAARQTRQAKGNLSRELLFPVMGDEALELSDDEAIELSGIDRDDSALLDANDPVKNAERIAQMDTRLYGEDGGEGQ